MNIVCLTRPVNWVRASPHRFLVFCRYGRVTGQEYGQRCTLNVDGRGSLLRSDRGTGAHAAAPSYCRTHYMQRALDLAVESGRSLSDWRGASTALHAGPCTSLADGSPEMCRCRP